MPRTMDEILLYGPDPEEEPPPRRNPKLKSVPKPATRKVDIKPAPVDIPISTPEPPVDIKIATDGMSGYPQDKQADIHKRDRHTGNRIGFFARISPEISRRINVFLAEYGIEKQDFLEQAAIHFIEAMDIHKAESADIKISLDDRRKMMWAASPTIINLYLQYLPGNRWKARDDREAAKYNSVDIRLVELGILSALIRTEQAHIHSFKYFVEEIEVNRAVPLADETLEGLLKHHRELYRRKKEGK